MSSYILEPFEQLLALVEAQAALLAIVGDQYGQLDPEDEGGFPRFLWGQLADAANDRLDTDSTGYHIAHIQFDVFSTDQDQAQQLADLADQMSDANLTSPGCLDSTHYKCNLFRRTSPWRRIEWPELQGSDGNQVVQLSSDWTFKFVRRQNVA